MKPEDLNDRFGDAYNTGNVDAMLELYEPDAALEFGPAGLIRGKQAIRAALEPFVALGGHITYRRRFCVVSGDLAVMSIEYKLTGGRVDTGGITVELARKQANGSWKYVIDLPNT